MKILHTIFIFIVTIAWCNIVQAQSFSDCEHKVIETNTIQAKYIDYNYEDSGDIPADLVLKVEKKEMRIIIHQHDIQNLDKIKKGSKVSVTYEKVNGWIGDCCDTYDELKSISIIK